MGIRIDTVEVGESKFGSIFERIQPAVGELFVSSNNLEDLLSRPRVAIVGTRKITPYGKSVTSQFASELARQGIVIVSGLAYGVDSVAHRAALEAGGLTIAVLPSSLESIYPSAHRNLAYEIVEKGGAILIEYQAGTISYKNRFVERNRIVSGMSNALLITEATDKSGTMHTARFALEQGIEVLAVPGNITSPTSAGTNNLIKTGAITVATPDDVLHVLGFKRSIQVRTVKGSNSLEQCILDLLGDNISDGNELMTKSKLDAAEFSQALTMMEITGKVKALGANQWTIA
jgi:DNA processing protein